MGEARAVCQSVILLLCTLIFIFVLDGNGTSVIRTTVSTCLSSLYGIYAFCMALVAVFLLQDSEVSDLFVLK